MGFMDFICPIITLYCCFEMLLVGFLGGLFGGLIGFVCGCF